MVAGETCHCPGRAKAKVCICCAWAVPASASRQRIENSVILRMAAILDAVARSAHANSSAALRQPDDHAAAVDPASDVLLAGAMAAFVKEDAIVLLLRH